jgi:HNH endonuclease
MAKPRLDHPFGADQLRSVLLYDQATGIFTWRDRPDIRPSVNAHRRGTVAGARLPKGYIHICINGRHHLAHRLAWLYVHEYWPPVEVDHINEIPSDNRIANLRLATHAQNNTRSKANRHNGSSGALGVYPAGTSGSRWQAQVQHLGVVHYVGCFRTIEEAKAARDEAARKLHGNFHRTTPCP